MTDEYRRRRDRAIEAVLSSRHVTASNGRHALGEAYDLAYGSFGPFIVGITDRMLIDMRSDLAENPDHRIVFVGRDGHSLAAAARGLNATFVATHCSEVVLSRVSVEAALQDYERSAGVHFDQLGDFRAAANRVDASVIDGAFRRLDRYLKRSGVPAGGPSSHVTLVDTSFKGTVQELLAAMYPETTFTGRYMSFGAAAEDPHPGSKFGYAAHLDSHDARRNELRTVAPDDAALTFANYDAVAVIEDFLHGARSSPTAIGDDGPLQQPGRFDQLYTPKLDPLRVDPLYGSPATREAVASTALVGVRDRAHVAAVERTQGRDPVPELRASSEQFRSEVHRWIGAKAPEDSRLGLLLDSFVQCLDDANKTELTKALDAALGPARLRRHKTGRSLDTPDLFDYPEH